MGGTRVLVALSLCLMVATTLGQISHQKQSYQAQQCRLNRLSANEPSDRIESEGGFIEFWDENDEGNQCSGVHAMRVTIQQNSLAIPHYFPFPRLIFVEQGEGILGVTFPGCPETYHSSSRQGGYERPSQWEQGRGQGQQGREYDRSSQREQDRGLPWSSQGEQGWQFSQNKDLYQKVHRFKRGDVLAIPPGAVTWTYNDGNEEIVAVHVSDLQNPSNQLDQSFRAFYLAGGSSERSGKRGTKESFGGKQSHHQIQNIFDAFDNELMAEAFDVPEDLIERIQQNRNRGFIVRVEQGEMRISAPEGEQYEEEYEQRRKYMGLDINGLEESICTMKLRHSTLQRQESDVYSPGGGRLNIINEQKLPVLRYLDMSLERGTMYPNTLYSPHWAVNSHSIVYILNGDAHIQVVDQSGNTLLDDRVNEGELFVIPQFFAVTVRAGNNGFEYVSFKTTSNPMKSPLVGYTSVFRAMPLQVLTNSYQVSPSEAQQLKYSREHQTFFLPSKSGKSPRY